MQGRQSGHDAMPDHPMDGEGTRQLAETAAANLRSSVDVPEATRNRAATVVENLFVTAGPRRSAADQTINDKSASENEDRNACPQNKHGHDRLLI